MPNNECLEGSRGCAKDLLKHQAEAMHAFHVPQDTRNPYQGSLISALSRCGVVATLERTRLVSAKLVSTTESPLVLHVHWLPRGYWSLGNFFEFQRFKRIIRLARARGAAVVWTVHNLYSHESKNRFRERNLARFMVENSDGLIVHSARAEAMVRAEFKVSPSKPIAVIPHGNYVETYPNTISASAARSRLGLLPDHRVLVFLGNIRPYKGVPELLHAFHSIDMANARLVIAGQPQDENARLLLEQMAAQDNRVMLRLGFVPDEDIQVYMQAADAVVLPYLNVLTSGAAVLAMSFGRACVAPLSGCLSDCFSAQRELMYEPDEPGALARALLLSLTKVDATLQMGKRNFFIAEAWSWDAVARQTRSFYVRCVSQKRAS